MLIRYVALRKESVDRNMIFARWAHIGKVALRKESVDRNTKPGTTGKAQSWSLSARRAWIEIDFAGSDWVLELSLSARRAWIEIAPMPA